MVEGLVRLGRQARKGDREAGLGSSRGWALAVPEDRTCDRDQRFRGEE